jgi:Transposase DDE domain
MGYRERILSLPVMVGILLSLVWRQIASVSELSRMLARESLVWVEPTEISQQALSARLDALPAELFALLWGELLPELQQRAAQRPTAHAALLEKLAPHYERVWVLDSSRLEAVFKKTQALRGVTSTVLGGTLTTVLDLASHLPVQVWLDDDARVNDRQILDKLAPLVPKRTILLLDRGFARYSFFDTLTESGSVLVSQWGTHWSFEVVQTHQGSPTEIDQTVRVGKYRSSRCHHAIRRIGRQDAAGVWHYWVTTELDPERLPAEQVIALYAQRWRIEEAFLQCKRLLNLSYLWGSSVNAIALQVWTTVLLYGVLVDLCGEAAMALAVPPERISMEMLYRSLYHYARAVQRGEPRRFIAWVSDPRQADLGIVKRQRKPPTTALARMEVA